MKYFTKGTNNEFPEDDHLGIITLEEMNGYTINMFEVFIPMIQLEKSDTVEVQWTIIKN